MPTTPTTIQWSADFAMGTPPPGLSPGGPPMTAGANKDGHLELFVLANDGNVWHIWQTAPNSQTWSPWSVFASPKGVTFTGKTFTVVSNEDGRLEVFAVAGDNSVWHIWQLAANANWAENWQSLGVPASTLTLPFFQVANNEIGALEVFCFDPTGQGLSKGQTQANGNFAMEWKSIPPPPELGLQGAYNVLAVQPPATALLQLYYYDAITGHISMNQRALTLGWDGWKILFNGPQGPAPNSFEIVYFVANQDQRLEMLCSDGSNIWHTWQSSGSTWSGFWDNFGSPYNSGFTFFNACLDGQGIINIVAWSNDRTGTSASDQIMYTLKQTSPNSGWSGWALLREGQTPNQFGQPLIVLAKDQNGLLELFSFGDGNQVYRVVQQRLGK